MYIYIAGVAQLVEQLICNQRVGGSNPLAGSVFKVKSKVFENFLILLSGLSIGFRANGRVVKGSRL